MSYLGKFNESNLSTLNRKAIRNTGNHVSFIIDYSSGIYLAFMIYSDRKEPSVYVFNPSSVNINTNFIRDVSGLFFDNLDVIDYYIDEPFLESSLSLTSSEMKQMSKYFAKRSLSSDVRISDIRYEIEDRFLPGPKLFPVPSYPGIPSYPVIPQPQPSVGVSSDATIVKQMGKLFDKIQANQDQNNDKLARVLDKLLSQPDTKTSPASVVSSGLKTPVVNSGISAEEMKQIVKVISDSKTTAANSGISEEQVQQIVRAISDIKIPAANSGISENQVQKIAQAISDIKIPAANSGISPDQMQNILKTISESKSSGVTLDQIDRIVNQFVSEISRENQKDATIENLKAKINALNTQDTKEQMRENSREMNAFVQKMTETMTSQNAKTQEAIEALVQISADGKASDNISEMKTMDILKNSAEVLFTNGAKTAGMMTLAIAISQIVPPDDNGYLDDILQIMAKHLQGNVDQSVVARAARDLRSQSVDTVLARMLGNLPNSGSNSSPSSGESKSGSASGGSKSGSASGSTDGLTEQQKDEKAKWDAIQSQSENVLVSWGSSELMGSEVARQQIGNRLIEPMTFQRAFKTQQTLLLFGPPGTGKTQIASAFVNELRSSITGDTCVDHLLRSSTRIWFATADSVKGMYTGDVEKGIKRYFNKLRDEAKRIQFQVNRLMRSGLDKTVVTQNNTESDAEFSQRVEQTCFSTDSKETYDDLSDEEKRDLLPYDGSAIVKSVLFLDEFDSLASQRNNPDTDPGGHMSSSVNPFLQNIGVKDDPYVIVIAATNLPWNLDPAILRRFKVRIFIDFPDYITRFGLILGKLVKRLNWGSVADTDLKLERIANGTSKDGSGMAEIIWKLVYMTGFQTRVQADTGDMDFTNVAKDTLESFIKREKRIPDDDDTPQDITKDVENFLISQKHNHPYVDAKEVSTGWTFEDSGNDVIELKLGEKPISYNIPKASIGDYGSWKPMYTFGYSASDISTWMEQTLDDITRYAFVKGIKTSKENKKGCWYMTPEDGSKKNMCSREQKAKVQLTYEDFVRTIQAQILDDKIVEVDGKAQSGFTSFHANLAKMKNTVSENNYAQSVYFSIYNKKPSKQVQSSIVVGNN